MIVHTFADYLNKHRRLSPSLMRAEARAMAKGYPFFVYLVKSDPYKIDYYDDDVAIAYRDEILAILVERFAIDEYVAFPKPLTRKYKIHEHSCGVHFKSGSDAV